MKSKDVDRRSIWLLAKEYLSSPYVTFECVGANHDLSGRMVSNILWRGIAENILSTTVAEAVYSKIIHSSYRGRTARANRWDEAFDKRQETREKMTKKLAMFKEWEKLLVYRTEHYDEYVASCESPSSLEEINERLNKLREIIPHYVSALR